MVTLQNPSFVSSNTVLTGSSGHLLFDITPFVSLVHPPIKLVSQLSTSTISPPSFQTGLSLGFPPGLCDLHFSLPFSSHFLLRFQTDLIDFPTSTVSDSTSSDPYLI